MKIILTSITAAPKSGWGTITYNYACALWAAGTPFVLLLPRFAERTDVPFSSCIKYILPELPLTFSGYASWRFVPRLYFPIPYVPEKGDVVHSLLDFPYAALAFRYARSHRLPFLMNAIGTYSVAPFGHFIDRILFMPAYRHADRIIAISTYTKNRMIAAAGYSRSVDVVRLPALRPVPEGSENFSIFTKLPVGRRYVLTVTSPRTHGRKGFEDICAAFAILSKEMPDVHLIAVGGALSTTDSCTVIPEVTAAELAALYARCSVFAAMPYGTGDHFEGYGLVYREAGLYGKPVIGTASGGVPEAIEDGVTGFLVPEHCIAQMAAALRLLLHNPVLTGRLGDEGRVQAENYTWQEYAERMLLFYRSASI